MKKLHRDDDNHISVRELWESWVRSEVHNWTVSETVDWLTVFVGLPQYSRNFLENSLNGSFLPRLDYWASYEMMQVIVMIHSLTLCVFHMFAFQTGHKSPAVAEWYCRNQGSYSQTEDCTQSSRYRTVWISKGYVFPINC